MQLETLIGTDKRVLTEQEWELMLILHVAESTNKGIDIKEDDFGFLYNVLKARLIAHEVPVSIPLMAFVSTLIDNPAKAVMWAYTFNAIYKEFNKPVTLLEFGECFTYGVPTEEEYKRIWDLQKIKSEYPIDSDNALDYAKNW